MEFCARGECDILSSGREKKAGYKKTYGEGAAVVEAVTRQPPRCRTRGLQAAREVEREEVGMISGRQ